MLIVTGAPATPECALIECDETMTHLHSGTLFLEHGTDRRNDDRMAGEGRLLALL
jgi:hypothetical protein